MSVVIPTEDLRVFFDAQSRSWDSRMIRDPVLLRCLLAWLPLQSGDSVLDVGTGTGVLLPYIREIAPQGEIDAVDISPGMLAVAQDKYGGDAHIHFISADVSKDMLPRRYHAIILYSVFPHLSQRDETVARLISDYLLPGGYLLIAHTEGRKWLNAMHRSRLRSSIRHDLFPVSVQARRFRRMGLNVAYAGESRHTYFILLSK